MIVKVNSYSFNKVVPFMMHSLEIITALQSRNCSDSGRSNKSGEQRKAVVPVSYSFLCSCPMGDGQVSEFVVVEDCKNKQKKGECISKNFHR